MECPFLRRRGRGSHAGRLEIVFSEDQGWEEAQEFAARMIDRLGLTVIARVNGPDAWLWDVHDASGVFVFGYVDFPCETTLLAADPASDAAVGRLFDKLIHTSVDGS